MNIKIGKIKRDLTTIKNSIEFIKDSNCIFIMKHLLVVIDDIVKVIDTTVNKTNVCEYCKTENIEKNLENE